MNRRFDVIVVGLGAMGALASYYLARRGARVLGLEQFDIPNTLGSSHGLSRMVRKLYHEHDDYIPLLERAYELWRELEQTTGSTLLHLTGGLFMGAPDTESIDGAIRTATRFGLAHEVLDQAGIAERYPQFHLPSNFIGFFEPTAGWMHPERTLTLACQQALLHGAELHGMEPLQNWEASPTGVTCRTSRGEYQADQIVFCGGPWTSGLLPGLGVPLTVTRQVLGWVWPKEPTQFSADKFPCWSLRKKDGTRLYGFPLSDDGPGLKLANHDRSYVTTPQTINRAAEPGDEATFRLALGEVLPAADGPLLSLRVCMYTNTPDLNFAVGRHPRQPRVLVACGFSGHGFKLASTIGSILADLALTGRTELPIDFLSPARFTHAAG